MRWFGVTNSWLDLFIKFFNGFIIIILRWSIYLHHVNVEGFCLQFHHGSSIWYWAVPNQRFCHFISQDDSNSILVIFTTRVYHGVIIFHNFSSICPSCFCYSHDTYFHAVHSCIKLSSFLGWYSVLTFHVPMFRSFPHIFVATPSKGDCPNEDTEDNVWGDGRPTSGRKHETLEKDYFLY